MATSRIEPRWPVVLAVVRVLVARTVERGLNWWTVRPLASPIYKGSAVEPPRATGRAAEHRGAKGQHDANRRGAHLRSTVIAVLALTVSGCASLGPGAIPRDRLDYQDALSASWKTQTLLNLVRLRYADPPIFLDVGSIVNSYSWEAGANFSTAFGPNVTKANNVGAHGTYTDRPTITYSPVAGEKFTKSIMTPLTPVAILSLIQVGYPVDVVFRLCVKAVNGVSNQSGAYALRRPADPAFVPMLEALRRVQASGAVGLRLEKRAGGEQAILLFRRAPSTDLEADQRFVAQTLSLQAGDEYRLVFGAIPADPGEIAILSRSMLEIMAEIGSGIDVPEKDIEEERVVSAPAFEGAKGATLPPLLHVRCAAEPPGDAYAAARYRDQWFWIDDRDIPSKRLFSFLMILFSLAETGGHPNLPVLTIPAG